MAADSDDANMVQMKGRRPDGSESRWPRCVIGSGAAHLILLVACVMLQPAAESPRSILRVTLLGGASAPETTPIVTDVARALAPPDVAALPRPKWRRPHPEFVPTGSGQTVAAPPRGEPLSPSAPLPADVHEPLLTSRSSAPHAGAAPPPPAAVAPNVAERVPPPEPLAANRDASAPGLPGVRDDTRLPVAGGGSGSAAPTRLASAEPRGAFVYDGQGRGSGAGTGSGAGSGNGDGWGSGAGAGGAPGGGDGQAGDSTQLARAGNGTGSGGRNGEQLLRTIRRQIERVWAYPDAARRNGLEGRVELRFRIAADGSAESVEILRSSGHAILDDDLTQTVRQAGPYPLYSGWVRFPFTYRLAE
jgi:protein TonB